MRRNALFRVDPDQIEDRRRSVHAPLLDQADALLDEARRRWLTGDADRMRRDVARLGRPTEDMRRTRLFNTTPLCKAATVGKRPRRNTWPPTDPSLSPRSDTASWRGSDAGAV